MNHISLSVPNVCGNEVKYVSETLADGWISAVGPYVNKFEEVVAKYAKVEKTVAVASGSAGLHLSYLEAGVKQGDIVVCPALTFIASINQDEDDSSGWMEEESSEWSEQELEEVSKDTVKAAEPAPAEGIWETRSNINPLLLNCLNRQGQS